MRIGVDRDREATDACARMLVHIQHRTACIATLGAGVAGLFQSFELASAGYRVFCYDVDADRIRGLVDGSVAVPDVCREDLQALVSRGQLVLTGNPNVLARADVVLISVWTGVTENGRPRLSAVQAAARTIAQHAGGNPLVVVKSTCYPGMTEEVIAPVLERRFGEPGVGFFLTYAPERGDPGSRMLPRSDSVQIVAGLTPACTELAATLYEGLGGRVASASSVLVAELAKLHENSFRLINISYVNELADLCRRVGVNPFEVINLAGTKGPGFMAFLPGPGVGGLYIPNSADYLRWWARTHLRHRAPVLGAAIKVNRDMPSVVVQLVKAILQRPLAGASIVGLGLGYKRGSGDIRNSPAVKVCLALVREGAEVTAVDPYTNGAATDGLPFRVTGWDLAVLERADSIVLLTDHPEFRPDTLEHFASRLVDTRGILGGPKSSPRVPVPAGA